MPVSQPKIELAVLYKLHQHAEADGEAITPRDVSGLFDVAIANRRVELALNELETRDDVERVYHPHYSDEGLWQISREGMAKVDRALRVPASFIARLHSNGDIWLDSEEAESAVLQKARSKKAEGSIFDEQELSDLAEQGTHVFPIPPTSPPDRNAQPQPFVINNNVSPVFNTNNNNSSSVVQDDPESKSVTKSGVRAGWVAAFLALVAIIVTLWVEGKIF